MANQRKNNNKMNMNMSRPSMLWLYGLIGAFIIGYYVFGDVNDTPVPSDWATVERMVEKGEVEKILIVNRDQAQVFLKKEAIAQYRRDTVDKRFRRLPETGVQLLFTIGSVDSFREDLKAAEQQLQAGAALPDALLNMKVALTEAGFAVDYVEARAPDLQKIEQFNQDIVLFAAAKLGATRLIDNLQVKYPAS